MLTYVLMGLGFGLVIKGADLFVGGASALAKRLRVSELAVGLTIVAFGTSLPELAVNVTASVQGNAGITIGNVIGSNIANILLILGIAGLISPLAVTKGTVWKEIPLGLLAALLLALMANDRLIDAAPNSTLTRIDAFILMAFFAIFLYYTASIARTVPGAEQVLPKDAPTPARIALLMVIGFVALLIGSRWVVGGAVKIAVALGVRQTIVGLTIVAVGTSLPELATSAAAAYRKNADIAIGNVVGSNIFNIFFILGLSGLIRPIPFETAANIDIGVLVVASLLLFLWMFTGKKRTLDRWEATLFLTIYVAYVAFTLIWMNQ